MSHHPILLVDDNKEIASTISQFLELHDYSVDICHNPRQAIDLMAENLYKIVLSDIQMPGMSGLELLKALKTRSPTTIVIMMTGFHDQSMVVECLENGAHDFLVKPIRPMELLVEVIAESEKKVARWLAALRPSAYDPGSMIAGTALTADEELSKQQSPPTAD